MKTLIKLSFALFVLSQLNYAQSKISDTLNINSRFNPSSSLQKYFLYDLENFDLYLELNTTSKNMPLNNDPNFQWLWTKAVFSNSYQSNNQQITGLDNMLSLQYFQFKEDSKFNPFRYALGMAQLSAVGYLAYKHIKKYGFK